MLPTPDQVGIAAYHRWQKRGYAHGHHVADWVAAERELAFDLNYEVVVRYRLDGVAPRTLGEGLVRRCRFCEQTSPRVHFASARLVLPVELGNQALASFEECDDCHAVYEESVEPELARLARLVLERDPGDRLAASAAAFKGLTRAALLVVPVEELQSFEDAIEWASNPDHDLDCRSLGGLETVIHRLPEPAAFSWLALARRSDDSMPLPYLVGFFATGMVVIQFPVPLSVRDQDFDGAGWLPRVASPFGPDRSIVESRTSVLTLAAPEPRKRVRMSFLPA